MNTKTQKRERRAQRVRKKIFAVQAARLCVHRTSQHIYAQIIDKSGDRVLASASTLEAEVRKEIKHGGNITAAKLIGKRIAEKAKASGVTKIAFDRSGFKYHGRVKALADSARENGLEF